MKTYNRCMLAALLSVGIAGTSALGKTKLVQSWADPSVANYKFSKVLALAVIDNPDIRGRAEAAIVRNIKKIKATPSAVILQKGEERDVETAKRKLREGGFDSAVVLRLVIGNDRVQYVAPTMPDPYLSYWSYNTYAWPIGATPGYIKYDRIVQVETLFYSITEDKLLWSGLSETSGDGDVSKLVDQIAKVIGKELQKKGIFK
jgi:hypothetical protein